MSEIMLGLDTGTTNTGFVKVKVDQGELMEIIDAGMLQYGKLPVHDRIAAIVRSVIAILDTAPKVKTMWVELFQFYGARKGALWNAMLVGALIYLPVTRVRRNLTAYGSSKIQWWSWYKKEMDVTDKKDMWDASRGFLFTRGVVITDEMEALFAGNQHLNDALGLLLYAIYGESANEYVSNNAAN